MAERFIVGRDREIAQLDLAIGDGVDGLRIAMLSGPSGLGKTTLTVEAIERATERGFQAILIRGRSGSLSTPFAPLIEAIPELRSLVELTVNTDAHIEQFGMMLVQIVTELAQGHPIFIVVDDTQALDESTIAVLPYLSGVHENTDLSLLYVEQTDAIDVPDTYRSYIDGLLASRVVSHLRLGPMGEQGIRQIAARQLNLDDIEQVPSEIIERSGGNPWFALELSNSWEKGSSSIPATIAAAATSKLYALDTDAQTIISALSLAPDGLHITWLEALVEQSPRQFVRTMEAINTSGLTREDSDIVSIAHPLMQQAIHDGLSVMLKRAVRLEIAEAINKSQIDITVSHREQGYYLAKAGRINDAVTHYKEAAIRSERTGKYHEARADLDAALKIELRTNKRIDLLRLAARLASLIQADNAPDLWQELSRFAAATFNDQLYAYSLYEAYVTSDYQLVEIVERASRFAPKTNGWSALSQAVLLLREEQLEQSLECYERAIQLSSKEQDEYLRALSLRYSAGIYGDLGDSQKAYSNYKSAISLFVSQGLHDLAFRTWTDYSSTMIDSSLLKDAVRESRLLDEYIVDHGLDHLRSGSLANLAYALSEIGELSEAKAYADQAAHLDTQFKNAPTHMATMSVFVNKTRAKIANDIGLPNAPDIARLACDAAERSGLDWWHIEAEVELIRAKARRDGISSILTDISNLQDNEEPIIVSTMTSWLLRSAVLNSNEAGIARVRELKEQYSGWNIGERTQIYSTEIDKILIALDDGDISPLDAIAAQWREINAEFEALQVESVAGAILLQRGEKKLAQQRLLTTKKGLLSCGASADADLIASLLRKTGARARSSSKITSVGPLTKRELEIARLVASSLKNNEISASLHLAEKTVAAHLSNIYAKLEIRSRIQLGQWIRENDPEFVAAVAEAV